MNKNKIMEKIIELCKDVFDDDELVVSESTSPDDVEDWDSLTNIQLISEVEKEFGVKFTMEEIKKFTNIGELITLLLGKCN